MELKRHVFGAVTVILCHVHVDVGPRQPDGFPRHRRRGRGDEIMGVDV